MSGDTSYAVLMSLLLLLCLLLPLALLVYFALDYWQIQEPYRRALDGARAARAEYVKRMGYSGETWENWVRCGDTECRGKR